MIGRTYITPNLILPFIHAKPVMFRFSDEKEFQYGEMDAQVFADGSCNIQILTVGRAFVTWHGDGLILETHNVSKLSWDGKQFVGVFER